MHWTSARWRSVSPLILFLLAPLASAQLTQRWSSPETTPLAGAEDEVTVVVPSGAGRLVLAVHSATATNQATRIRCRDADGALVWELDPVPAGVRLDEAHPRRGGGAYFTGTWSSPTGSAPPRMVATRIDDSGLQLWTDEWTPPNFDPALDLVQSTLDDAGNLWIVGTINFGRRAFARCLTPLGVELTHTQVTVPLTSIRAASAFPGGGVVAVGEQEQHPVVRVFDRSGTVRWSHTYTNVAPGTLSSYVDVVCSPVTQRVFACGTIDEGLPTQSGLVGVFDLGGAMVQGNLIRTVYGDDHPSSLETIALRSNGRPITAGRFLWTPPLWSSLWMELLPSGDAGYGFRSHGNPWDSAYPGTRIVTGSVDQVWVLIPWGPLSQGQPTVWSLEARGSYSYTAATFEAFPTGSGGELARWFGLERVDEGLALCGSLGPGPDGTSDGLLVVVDDSKMPTGYCAAEPNSLGCVPWIGWTGQLWDFSRPLYLLGGNLSNQSSALALYSTTGPNAVPFLSGTLCVAPPLRRSGVKFTGGSPAGVVDCSGTFQLHLNNLLAPDPFAHVPGNEIFLQVWSRDTGDGKGRGTGAMRITVP
jgi:hypothetical protein